MSCPHLLLLPRIFVSNLPRRLADDRHLQYEELLRQHFERQLSAEITPQMQMQGWTVISKEDVLVVGGCWWCETHCFHTVSKPASKNMGWRFFTWHSSMLGIPWDLGCPQNQPKPSNTNFHHFQIFPNFSKHHPIIPHHPIPPGPVSERNAAASLFHAARRHGSPGPQAGLRKRRGGLQRPGQVAGCWRQPGATRGGGAGWQEGPVAGGRSDFFGMFFGGFLRQMWEWWWKWGGWGGDVRYRFSKWF